MKRLLLLGVVVGVLLLTFVPAAFAWTPVVGCTFAGTDITPLGPWTYGGTVTARQTATNVVVGSGVLDANGCYSVTIGNGPQLTVTIDFTPGPGGDPADQTCIVPTDPNYTPAPYQCAPIYTGSGPNAVSLSAFGATGVPAGAAVAALGLTLGGFVAWLRRR